jgi:hypothetical protein
LCSTNGIATLVGSFNNSVIGNSGQNIRFGYDGNLFDTSQVAQVVSKLLRLLCLFATESIRRPCRGEYFVGICSGGVAPG